MTINAACFIVHQRHLNKLGEFLSTIQTDQGYNLMRIDWEPVRNSYALVVEHPDFKEVPEGAELPIIPLSPGADGELCGDLSGLWDATKTMLGTPTSEELEARVIGKFIAADEPAATAAHLTVDDLNQAKEALYAPPSFNDIFSPNVHEAFRSGLGPFLVEHFPDVPHQSNETPCNHRWARYTGFTESFDYCMKCDTKQDIRE